MKKIICRLCILSVLWFSGCGQMQEAVREDTDDVSKNAGRMESMEENTQESKEGYEEVQLSYMNASDLGWHCYEEDLWNSEEMRETLAQAALKELYTFTGENTEECVYYYTDGRSVFAFSDSPENMKRHKNIYYRDYGFELSGEGVPEMAWSEGTPILPESFSNEKIVDGEPQSHLENILLQILGKSGLYRGQKIEACKVVGIAGAEYSYFHLQFADGYYEVVTDKTAQVLMSISGPYFEEEKEWGTPTYMREIADQTYRNIITGMLETECFPISNSEMDGPIYEQSYAICDIDGDGREELIINYSNANSMAGMVYYVYDYHRTTGEIYIELVGWPGAVFLDNGYVKEEASHNHGRSNLDDFWPYQLLLYNSKEDIYETITHVDAWQKELYPKDFPDEADKDGDGILYYTASSSYMPTLFMDKEEYDIWCEQYNSGTQKTIQWKKIMTVEEYEAYMQSPKG